jgi:5-formyltetrahydrofolate cyclo-ligase
LIRLMKRGKKVLLPKVIPGSKNKQLAIFEVPALGALKPGFRGILEPSTKKKYLGSIDLILVPGLAFDEQGNRLGRGAGYFDRFLQHHSRAHKIGVAFKTQLVGRLPADSHDISVDEVAAA